jgi:hypothetical protein
MSMEVFLRQHLSHSLCLQSTWAIFNDASCYCSSLVPSKQLSPVLVYQHLSGADEAILRSILYRK